MSQHTRGPWHIGPNRLIVYAADGYAIADAKTFHLRHSPNEGEANARLIAAAPDMLATLEEMRSTIWHLTDPSNPGGPYDKRLERIDAAIAKARGEG